MLKTALRATAVTLLFTAIVHPTVASTNVVHVTLSAPDGGHEMAITLDHDSVHPGPVTFVVRNDSARKEHEMVIARVAQPNAPLPYDPGTDEVEEDGIDALGEVPELEPGASGEVTVDMSAGDYVLFCNVQGHYSGGMEIPFTVR